MVDPTGVQQSPIKALGVQACEHSTGQRQLTKLEQIYLSNNGKLNPDIITGFVAQLEYVTANPQQLVLDLAIILNKLNIPSSLKLPLPQQSELLNEKTASIRASQLKESLEKLYKTEDSGDLIIYHSFYLMMKHLAGFGVHESGQTTEAYQKKAENFSRQLKRFLGRYTTESRIVDMATVTKAVTECFDSKVNNPDLLQRFQLAIQHAPPWQGQAELELWQDAIKPKGRYRRNPYADVRQPITTEVASGLMWLACHLKDYPQARPFIQSLKQVSLDKYETGADGKLHCLQDTILSKMQQSYIDQLCYKMAI